MVQRYRQIHLTRLFLILCPFILACLNNSSPAAEIGEQTLVLKQQHPWLSEVTVHLTKNAMLVEVPSRKIDLFTQAPDWTVTLRNSARHIYVKMPYQKWIVTGMAEAANLDSATVSWPSIAAGTLDYKGLPVTRFKFLRVFKNGTTAPLSAGDEGFTLAYQGKETTPQAARVLDALLNQWNVPGIQLRSVKNRGSIIVPLHSGGEVAAPNKFDTISWQRVKAKPALDLKGYKLTNKADQIFFSAADNNMMEDLLAP